MSEQEDEKRTEMGVKAGDVGRGRERRAGRAEKDDERQERLPDGNESLKRVHAQSRKGESLKRLNVLDACVRA
eukprot:4908407-Pleurochrysis_carterae.AAC.1